jgi:hypothetical protein
MNPLHGDGYAFWSGIANDLPIYVLGVVPMFVAWYKRNKCHHPRCHRLGHHPYKHFQFCGQHHPIGNTLKGGKR